MEEIIGGSQSIIMPSNMHKSFTCDFRPNFVCKVTSNINFEIVVSRILIKLDKKRVNKYFTFMDIESLRKLSNNKGFTNFLYTLREFNYLKKPSVDLYYFTMEYSGKDLFELCSEHDLILFQSEKKFKNMVFQLIEGIKYLHEKSHICHFDIKPENIVYCPEQKHFKYIDFGYAEVYPFIGYINNGPKGTLDYIPLTGNAFFISKLHVDNKTPYIECNDWIPINNHDYHCDYIFYNKKTPELAFKADSYALGKTIYYVYHYFLEINNNINANFKAGTEALIYALINNDILERKYLWNIDAKKFYKIKKKSLELTPEFGSREYLYHERCNIDYGSRLIEAHGCENDSNDSSDSDSITSLEVQNTSRGCLSNVINKLSFKKLISYFLQ